MNLPTDAAVFVVLVAVGGVALALVMAAMIGCVLRGRVHALPRLGISALILLAAVVVCASILAGQIDVITGTG